MVVIHYFEDKTLLLSQLVKQIPSIDENIKIKGRKGKVLSVKNVEGNHVHVYVMFEKVVKQQALSKETKKKKR
ncbi:hypothetical protein [Metabacillus sediminilitoris]|uniref:Uncharacterized protein n=1 Tax=Metabacillus sediminilitoris TaxID=2567941 RepID=A0A4S4BVT7_9BACI|nr:hypothetical protein [Metabacillus sediminilitoris]QGQ46192.1 hypothetical protein GMB29_13780 [Metabacillus sediminilitoris]THF79245.1 hypothetical protein E6W99_12890 [Metabacillus sediminilitoris]